MVNGAAIEVHRALGPGLLESAYEVCLALELTDRRVRFARQVPVAPVDKGPRLDVVYRINLLMEDTVIVELKATESLNPVHEAQLFSCLRLMDKRVGLLLNFHVPALRDGIKRRMISSCEAHRMSCILRVFQITASPLSLCLSLCASVSLW